MWGIVREGDKKIILTHIFNSCPLVIHSKVKAIKHNPKIAFIHYVFLHIINPNVILPKFQMILQVPIKSKLGLHKKKLNLYTFHGILRSKLKLPLVEKNVLLSQTLVSI